MVATGTFLSDVYRGAGWLAHDGSHEKPRLARGFSFDFPHVPATLVRVMVRVSVMQAINFSDARKNLKAVFDRVVDDADVTIITRRDADDVVVMSLAEWNSWKETEYLLASPANARRLRRSLAQARTGKAKPRERPTTSVHAGWVREPQPEYKTGRRTIKPERAVRAKKRP
ncbi:MAG: type II toxin-antitoxin system Phd/YefM family antitoxin [Rhodanobacteraceae bacterium]